jgi:hypothetical protein
MVDDIGSNVEWEIWYQDTFDGECPRQIDVSGRGLVRGLIELWARHLFETVGVDGREGFSRFNLWWKQEAKSVRVVGNWGGMVQLRGWVFGDKRQAHKGYVKEGDKGLLKKVAAVHGRLILAGQTSEGILALAEDCASRKDFERQLLSLGRDAWGKA